MRGPEGPESVDISRESGIIGTGTRGQEILEERSLREAETEGPVSPYHEINIHGARNSELDEVDLPGRVIYEDKDATKIYMENPDVPQTVEQWVEKQVYKKTQNRILALQQNEFKMSSKESSLMPPANDLKDIRVFVFRVNADTPELRTAVQAAMERLCKEFPGYEFYAVFGGE